MGCICCSFDLFDNTEIVKIFHDGYTFNSLIRVSFIQFSSIQMILTIFFD
jgi:hypothetical protein